MTPGSSPDVTKSFAPFIYVFSGDGCGGMLDLISADCGQRLVATLISTSHLLLVLCFQEIPSQRYPGLPQSWHQTSPASSISAQSVEYFSVADVF